MAGSGGPIVMKSVTQTKDGSTNFTKIDSNKEIVGYYGYLDDKDYVMAIGLMVMAHEI